MSEDQSAIRPDKWGPAWDALLRWTVQYVLYMGKELTGRRAWEAYLDHPVGDAMAISADPAVAT